MVAQMKHEISIYNSRNSQYKQLEAENNDLKSKIQNLASVECILFASQEDIDDVLKRQYSSQELYTMVGALKRELHQNELKRNELKKHLNLVKNELKAEKIEKNKLSEKLNDIESRINETENVSVLRLPKKDEDNITPSNVKKRKIFNEKKSPDTVPSNSPYFSVVRTSSTLISSALKTPLGLKQVPIRTKTQGLSNLSIFKKPHFTK
jgi:chromosome segregation ATPase